jgi:hypothetical protein
MQIIDKLIKKLETVIKDGQLDILRDIYSFVDFKKDSTADIEKVLKTYIGKGDKDGFNLLSRGSAPSNKMEIINPIIELLIDALGYFKKLILAINYNVSYVDNETGI